MPSPSHISLVSCVSSNMPPSAPGCRAQILLIMCYLLSVLPLTSPGLLVHSFSSTACLHCPCLGQVFRSHQPPQMHVTGYSSPSPPRVSWLCERACIYSCTRACLWLSGSYTVHCSCFMSSINGSKKQSTPVSLGGPGLSIAGLLVEPLLFTKERKAGS